MAEIDPLEQLIHETRAFVDMRRAPDLTRVVMHQVEQLDVQHAEAGGSISRFVRSLWTPRVVRFDFRPAYAVFAAAGVMVLTAVVPYRLSTADRQLTVANAQTVAPQVYVQFRLETPGATDVRLAGSFTQWQPQYQLHETAPGLWTITLPLAPGVHDYAFVVDGRRWVTDPYARTVQDGFGGTNNRITLVPGSDRRL